MHTPRGKQALKVIENKIQSLLRKKAWRHGAVGSIPVHMGVEDFKYPIPEDKVTAALRVLLTAERASRDKFEETEINQLESAMKQAEEALAQVDALLS